MSPTEIETKAESYLMAYNRGELKATEFKELIADLGIEKHLEDNAAEYEEDEGAHAFLVNVMELASMVTSVVPLP